MPTGSKSKGFTLIEVVIVLAIVGILAAVAFPSYQKSVQQTNRAEGQAFLLTVAQAQERHFTQWGRYANTLVGAAATATNLGWGAPALISENNRYTIAFAPAIPVTPTSFTLMATPFNLDPICGNLTLSQTGARLFTNPAGTPRQCW